MLKTGNSFISEISNGGDSNIIWTEYPLIAVLYWQTLLLEQTERK